MGQMRPTAFPQPIASSRSLFAVTNTYSIDHPGDPRHPDHAAFLAALGEATYAVARVSGICFDILRVLGAEESQEMYNDPLGTLENKLRKLLNQNPSVPELADFLALLGPARETRNDLLHALPVKDGLHRRKANDLAYVRNFYTVEDVEDATAEFTAAWRKGSQVLYADGGASVAAWTAAGGS